MERLDGERQRAFEKAAYAQAKDDAWSHFGVPPDAPAVDIITCPYRLRKNGRRSYRALNIPCRLFLEDGRLCVAAPQEKLALPVEQRVRPVTARNNHNKESIMKIGLQFAMPAELHALPGARDLAPLETVSGIPVFEVAEGILACAGGVSKVNAAMAAELLCLHCGVELILNAGVAGCCRDLPIGTLVLARDFVQHDVDTSAVGDPIGLVSTVNRVDFPTWRPEHCQALLRQLGFSAQLGRVATGDWFAVGGDRARWVRDTFSPTLCEMEGGAIAQVCLRNNVRFVSLKSVSDRLFSERQAEEYFDFSQALEALGRVVLPFAKKLQEEC